MFKKKKKRMLIIVVLKFLDGYYLKDSRMFA